MWFKDNKEIYWIQAQADKNIFHPDSLPPPSYKIPNRLIKGQYDVFSRTFDIQGDQFNWYVTLDPTIGLEEELGVANLKDYPKFPTFLALDKFMGEKMDIKLDIKGIFLKRTNNQITLLWRNVSILGWKIDDTLKFYTNNISADEAIELYKKFGLPSLSYRLESSFGYWEVNLPTGWTPITYNLTITMPDFRIVDPDSINAIVEKYKRNMKTINEYVESISPSTIIKMAEGVPSGTIIPSRCVGCKISDTFHLKVHVHRKEFSFYLLYSVCSEYAKEKDGPLGITWLIIQACRNLDGSNVLNPHIFADFKVKLQSFLKNNMINTTYQLLTKDLESGPHRLPWSLKSKNFSEPPSFHDDNIVPPSTGGVVDYSAATSDSVNSIPSTYHPMESITIDESVT